MRTRQNYSQSDLDRALAGDKNLTGADLTGADLTGANLTGANLTGANLTGANLTGANLTGATLYRAHLTGADLTGANLTGANLTGANLTRANLTEAELRGADLIGANLYRATLSLADLTKAELREAYLNYANLTRAILTGANLHRAELNFAELNFANLSNADLTLSAFTGADLTGADLTGADLSDADLSDADLTGAILDGIIYDGSTVWPEDFEPQQKERYLKRAYGAMTGPVLKFGKPEVSYRAQDFKRRYPQEFDLLKRKTGVTDFSPQFAENLRQTNITPYDWIVTHGKYGSTAQRLCPEPNFVLLLNIDLDDERFTEQQKNTLRGLAETSRRSGHPHEKNPLFTVGWVRICRDDDKGVWLVEELQSDVQVVRQQKNDERLGLARKRLDEIMDIMQPYVDRFYEDALGITLIEAEKLGFEVEMLDYETKREMGISPPRSVYKDLPLSMGISAKRKSKVLPDLSGEVRWTRPNPRLRR